MNTTTCIYYTDNHFESAFRFMINLTNERLEKDKKLKFEECALQFEECIRNRDSAKITFNNGDQILAKPADQVTYGIRWHYAYIDTQIKSDIVKEIILPCAISYYYNNKEESFFELKEPVNERIHYWGG